VVTHDDLRWADGIAWGTPTRYGNMTAPMKQFIDTTGSLWLKGELEDKATGIFTSTATIHGGQETTILTALVPCSNAGRFEVEHPGDYAAFNSYQPGCLQMTTNVLVTFYSTYGHIHRASVSDNCHGHPVPFGSRPWHSACAKTQSQSCWHTFQSQDCVA
jgi:multimeric flavodoxin WrbA